MEKKKNGKRKAESGKWKLGAAKWLTTFVARWEQGGYDCTMCNGRGLESG